MVASDDEDETPGLDVIPYNGPIQESQVPRMARLGMVTYTLIPEKAPVCQVGAFAHYHVKALTVPGAIASQC